MDTLVNPFQQGHAQRRRTGTPSSTLNAAQGPPPPPDPHTIIASQYHMKQGWMDANSARGVMEMVDGLHGAGVGKAAHQGLIEAGVIRKQRARSTTYHWNG